MTDQKPCAHQIRQPGCRDCYPRGWCCFIADDGTPCRSDAEWQIENGRYEGDTQSRTQHVGDLLDDAPVHTITWAGE